MCPRFSARIARFFDCWLVVLMAIVCTQISTHSPSLEHLQPQVSSSKHPDYWLARNGIPRRREGGGTRYTG